MGMAIFESSSNFNPANHGLKIGDEINIICVGGGQGGMHFYSSADGSKAGDGGNGAASSFGNIVTAKGGSQTTGQYIKPPNRNIIGGSGGFILGVNDWGGLANVDTGEQPAGSAGASDASKKSGKYDGYKNGGGHTYTTNGGNGYGAGGANLGGGGPGHSWKGGNSGEVVFKTHKLTSLSTIAVSVGGGGGGGYANSVMGYAGKQGTTSGGGDGGYSSNAEYGKGGYGGIRGAYGSSVTGGGGAGGCVIVFW